MMYEEGYRITEKKGNNAFSYEQRKVLGSEGKIYVTNLIEGGYKDVQVGNNIVFEELNTQWELESFCGLKHFVKINNYKTPIYVMDNHNHALAFWWMEFQNKKKTCLDDEAYTLIHVDQHSDMNSSDELEDIVDNELWVKNFVNYQCDVGSFIVPATELNIVNEIKWVKSEFDLFTFDVEEFKAGLDGKKLILDIDLDFWAPGMDIEKLDESFEKVKKMMKLADLVTIATSPYFLDQKLAIDLLYKLFE